MIDFLTDLQAVVIAHHNEAISSQPNELMMHNCEELMLYINLQARESMYIEAMEGAK